VTRLAPVPTDFVLDDLTWSLLIGSAVLLVAVAAVRISVRSGLPSLLIFLAIGLLLGENGLGISFDSEELTQVLGRSPTPRELAEAIGCSVEEIVEGIESSNAYSTLSLDATDDSGEDGGVSMLEVIGLDDDELEQIEIRESIKPLIEALPSREKQILLLRFFKNKTQSEIASEIGVSQMHVSRLLSRTLAQLRRSLHESS